MAVELALQEALANAIRSIEALQPLPATNPAPAPAAVSPRVVLLP